MPKKEYSDELMSALSTVLLKQRERRGLSQNELASLSGLHRSYIGDMERGARSIAVRNLWRMSEVFGVQPSILLKGAEKLAQSNRRKQS
jgi:transcriptional regulator with XRE-family HTH domain